MMADEDRERALESPPKMRTDGGKSLLDRVFGALSHQRRRYTLYYLRENDEAEVDELASQVAAWERDVPVVDVPAEASEEVRSELVHSHLPKLEEYGLVEYDQRSGAVVYTNPPTLLDEALKLAVAIENP